MAFFAPSVLTPQRKRVSATGGGMFGVATRAGVRVTGENYCTLSSVWAARTVLCEGVLQLPLNLVRQTDARSREQVSGNQAHALLTTMPCPNMDAVTWFDLQVGYLVDRGNLFAEKQRDLLGKVVAYWPIHPSRIPPQNIIEAERDYPEYGIRQGEVVYLVRGDEGQCTPIPARDMLHIPGRGTGIKRTPAGVPYGIGVPDMMAGAESIGNMMAVERAAGSFFANGMSSRFVLQHPAKVSPEAAKHLREQWQQTYGGAENSGKAIITEEGMTVQLLSISPEAAQMISAREFTVREVARWYRLPPHMLADLGRATWGNIDAESLNYVVHSLMPWLVRLEKGFRRQLLEPEQWADHAFKFNVNGLLRGDYAARSAFYKEMFNIGVFSQNDIRALEDLNPIEGGDRYYVPTNNLTPIDRVDDAIDAKMKQPTPAAKDPQQKAAEDENRAELKALVQDSMEVTGALAEAGRDLGERADNALALVESRASDLAERQVRLADRERAFVERQRDASRATLQCVLTGLVKREIGELQRASKDCRSFAETVEKFYADKLPAVWDNALSPLVEMLGLCGVEFDVAGELASHVAASRGSLAEWESVQKPNENLAPWISSRVEAWSVRPAETTARIVPELEGVAA